MLVPPQQDRPFYVYLSVGDTSIASIHIQKHDDQEREREPMKLEPEEEEIAMATGSWGFLRCWLREEDEFVVKGVDSGRD